MSKTKDQIINFCNIQIQIMADKENRLRKEILDCKLQVEFLTQVLSEMHEKGADDDDD